MTIDAEDFDRRVGLVLCTTESVCAYVSHNAVPVDALPGVISRAYQTLESITLPQMKADEPASALVPAVPIKKSIADDYLICLEDGKKFKSLKRHLRSQFNMTPDEYRAKWGLDREYPMVAPNYARTRSELAKNMGLGQQRKKALVKTAPAPKPAKAAA